jgi:hypothetical protein
MVASRKALPRPSAVARFARGAIEAMRIDLSQQKLKLESHKRTFTTRQERDDYGRSEFRAIEI